jgi:Retrotransposon gag protein
MDDYAVVDWADNHSGFVNHLRINFSPFNVEVNVENKLDKLQMKQNHKIAKYIVTFSQLALEVQWGEAAIQHTFYMGLPPLINDELTQIHKPNMLVALWNLLQSINGHYWETHRDIPGKHH